MLIIPAVDLMDGKVVRLYKGDMDNYKVYSDNPVDTAEAFISMGARRLHVVDLDGAKNGSTVNFSIIEKIAALGGLEIEYGGGLRDIKRIDACFNAGITYAILGTMIVKNPDATAAVLEKHPARVMLGIDARQGKVAVSGWYEDSGMTAADLVARYADYNVAGVIYTDIDKDGTLTGINTAETDGFARISPFPVTASGGVSSHADIQALRDLNNPNITGCIVGKAYYEGRLDLAAELKL